MPCGVTITMTGENAGYSRLYLHNTVSGKWQFLNSYKDVAVWVRKCLKKCAKV